MKRAAGLIPAGMNPAAEFGVYQARRAGLEAKDVANTRCLAQFRKLLRR